MQDRGAYFSMDGRIIEKWNAIEEKVKLVLSLGISVDGYIEDDRGLLLDAKTLSIRIKNSLFYSIFFRSVNRVIVSRIPFHVLDIFQCSVGLRFKFCCISSRSFPYTSKGIYHKLCGPDSNSFVSIFGGYFM
jgi:hypothetical protein